MIRPAECRIDIPRDGATTAAFGVVQWFHLGDHGAVERTIAGLRRLGIRHLRTGISWADCHAGGGQDWYAWLLPKLGQEFDLLPCFTYTPPSLGLFRSTAAPPREPKSYADFLNVFVSRHGRWFSHVELWNEPNNLLDWDWRADPDWHRFAEMVGGAAYWMKTLGKTVVLGGMCPTDANWLRQMGARGVLEHVDVVGVHAFPETWSHDFSGWDREIDNVQVVLDRFLSPADIWITECGYPTWRHDDLAQARALIDALAAPAPRVYWYSFADLDPARPTQAGFHNDERHYHTGLVTHAGRDKLVPRLLASGGLPAVRTTVSLFDRHGPPASAAGRIVITGGCGFVGSNIADRLASRGDDVLVVDNLSRPGSQDNASWLVERHPERVTLSSVDLRDARALVPLVRDARAVLHLAAQVAVTSSIEEPADDFAVNAAGTLALLEAARAGCPESPFIFASTNKVYGSLDHIRLQRDARGWWPADGAVSDTADSADDALRRTFGVDEAAALDFVSPYGCSKGAADQYVRDYAPVFGLPTVVLRMSCVYGPRQLGTEDQGWIAHFVRRAAEGGTITIYGDGEQVRDALYIDDAVDAWIAVLDNIAQTRGRVFNLGGGVGSAISLNSVVEQMRLRQGRQPRLAYATARPGDQLWYVSDTRALAAATGWHASVPLETGLDRLSRWIDCRSAPAASLALTGDGS